MSHTEVDCGTDAVETGSKLYPMAVFGISCEEDPVPVSEC